MILKKLSAIVSAMSLSLASLPVSAVDIAPVKTVLSYVNSAFPEEGTFGSGDGLPWKTECSAEGTGILKGTVSDGAYSVYVENAGGESNGGVDRWDCMFWQTGITLKYGHRYRITYSVNTDTAGYIYTKLGDINYDEAEYFHQCGNLLDMTYQSGISQAELEQNLRNAPLINKQSTDSDQSKWDVSFWEGWDSWRNSKLPVNEWVTYAFEFVPDKSFMSADGVHAIPEISDGTGCWSFHIGGDGLYSPEGCLPSGTTIKFDNLALIDMDEEETPSEPTTEEPSETTTTTAATTAVTTTTTSTTTTTTTNPPSTTTATKFTWGKDNWNFNNTDRFFNHLADGSAFPSYFVKDEIMYQLKDDFHVTNTQFENIRKKIESTNQSPEAFGGSCFGMTVSEILVKQGNLDLTHYGGTDIINENTNTAEMLSVINFIQNLQNSSELTQAIRQRAVMDGSFNYTQAEILDKITNAAENGDFLMKMGIRIEESNGSYGGHAVLVYGVEDCDYYSSYTYKKYDKRLLIADPNYLNQNKVTENACLYYNSSDYSWIIPIYTSGNRSCYWNASSGEKTSHGAVTNIMRYDSLTASKDLMVTTEMKNYVAGLEVNTPDTENAPKFSRVANTGNPNLEYASANSSGVFEYNLEWADEQNQNTKVYAAPDNTAAYELTYNNPTDFGLVMDYEQISYFADVKNSSYALFKPSGQFTLRGSNASYDVAIVTNDNKCVTDWYSVGVSGARTDNLTYTLTKAGYELTSDNLKNITVSAHNDKASPSLTFSTEYTSVLIYEIDENTIGIKADTDNDGSYDTVIAQSESASYGDVTGDEEIDIRDVIMINKAIFGKITLTDEQNKAADINKDGMPDASDSLTIMKYIVKLIDTLA